MIKYYAEGKLVRTSKKDNYKYYCSKTNQMAETREALEKRIHYNAFYVVIEYKKNRFLYQKIKKMTSSEYDELIKTMEAISQREYNECVNSIVELTKVGE